MKYKKKENKEVSLINLKVYLVMMRKKNNKK